jgi:glutamate 5-kinase
VGIVSVDGNFEAGDAVEVTAGGAIIGKGISEYASRELAQVLGMKTEQVRELLPRAADEVVNRDRFVLL